VGERDAAQAPQLIQALREARDKLISRMTWLEKHGAQLEAAALRRDVNEAQAHITRLQRRVLPVLERFPKKSSRNASQQRVTARPTYRGQLNRQLLLKDIR
jgi:hypothetical protein